MRYILGKRKAMEILAALSVGAKGLREIYRAVGGGFTTIEGRVDELLDLGLIEEKEVWDEEESREEYVPSKRWLKLADRGFEQIERIKRFGLWEDLPVRWDREKWIVLGLHAIGEIRGRTRFMKLLFLQKTESNMIKGDFYKFKPGDFGPLSIQFYKDIDELEHDRLVDVKLYNYRIADSREGTLWIHRLTPKGEGVAERILKKSPSGTEKKIQRMLKRFNDMSLLELLKYVYSRHPEYATRSILEWKEEYES